eukprot:scaffold650801_cov15-Prasinocladus_malaysianus.AAC.1
MAGPLFEGAGGAAEGPAGRAQHEQESEDQRVCQAGAGSQDAPRGHPLPTPAAALDWQKGRR